MRTSNPAERVEKRVFLIRGRNVMLDSDLANLYGVPTKRLNEQVRRNLNRFPSDFAFQLTNDERAGRGKRRPYVFTGQGVAMLSSVLNSKRAIQMNIAIIRALMNEPAKSRKRIGFRVRSKS